MNRRNWFRLALGGIAALFGIKAIGKTGGGSGGGGISGAFPINYWGCGLARRPMAESEGGVKGLMDIEPMENDAAFAKRLKRLCNDSTDPPFSTHGK